MDLEYRFSSSGQSVRACVHAHTTGPMRWRRACRQVCRPLVWPANQGLRQDKDAIRDQHQRSESNTHTHSHTHTHTHTHAGHMVFINKTRRQGPDKNYEVLERIQWVLQNKIHTLVYYQRKIALHKIPGGVFRFLFVWMLPRCRMFSMMRRSTAARIEEHTQRSLSLSLTRRGGLAADAIRC